MSERPAFVNSRTADARLFVSSRLVPNKAMSEKIYSTPAPVVKQPVPVGFQSRRIPPAEENVVSYQSFFGMYRRKHPRVSAKKISMKYELAMSLMGL